MESGSVSTSNDRAGRRHQSTPCPNAPVLLLFASRRGWFDLPGTSGTPLTALPWGWFFGMNAGRIGGGGTLSRELTIGDDPAARGFPITCQAAVFGTAYPIALTNGITRILGE
jgi:hypothetical protein